MTPHISVVIATHDRVASVVRLLAQLDAQSLQTDAFEVIVVDDGSKEPVAPILDAVKMRVPYEHLRIEWSGQAAARHQGAMLARGRVLVFVDDDMQVGAGFLAAHLGYHAESEPVVVLGHLQNEPGIGRMGLLERFNGRQLARWRQSVLDGDVAPRGLHLCTGNVSMRRRDYLAVGGFNVTLRRSEDRELGIRLEKHGCRFVYADDAVTVHYSDHNDSVWLRRAFLYGQFDHTIAALHPDVVEAHPWRFFSLIHPLSRPAVALALVAPALGRLLSRTSYAVARGLDVVRLTRLAVTLTALAYALEYFRGLRESCGSFSAFWKDRPGYRTAQPGPLRVLMASVRADHDAVRANRLKYSGEVIPRSRLPLDMVSRVGFQMMAAYRVMRLLADCRVPVLPLVVSRLVRHLYGAEIHWRTRIAPGVSIVHGNGIVLSHGAEVGEGCILFHNVTLGESLDTNLGRVGAPRLGRNVHVGPGATLLGPIEIGDNSKIAAGAVVMRSIPANSLVSSPQTVVSARSTTARPFDVERTRVAS